MLQRREKEAREEASIGMQNGRKQRLVSRSPLERPYAMKGVRKCSRSLRGVIGGACLCCTGLPEVPIEDVSSRRSSPRLRTQSDKIRDQENAVLDIFSQESFFKVRQNAAPP